MFLIVLSLISPFGFAHLHADPAVIAGAIPTLRALSWGTFPLLLYFALRRHLQAFNHVRMIAATLVSANLVNILFDWLLIFGHRWEWHGRVVGWKAMGVVGSGIATSLARVYQALFLIAALLIVDRKQEYGLLAGGFWRSLKPDWPRLRRLLELGMPSGATILVEIAIFAAVTSIIATLGPVPLAGHEIALNCASFTFMIPLGVFGCGERAGGAGDRARRAGGGEGRGLGGDRTGCLFYDGGVCDVSNVAAGACRGVLRTMPG